ncbi:MAG: SsrA-binding protein SmpB [Kofleriaceae bacterium]|nr:SsrA-binding protein SmpB [Myxococcales bacterium]MCB9562168.1 SsrA-binding protein SmpB [Kofleriaceae bacterium]
MKQAAAKDVIKVVATNRRATHDFHVHERIEAGIVLVGSEVKSLREAKVTLTDGFAQVAKGEVWLEGMTINEYAWANRFNHEVRRRRKLLLHKDEIKKLTVKTQLRGYTLVPLSLYFKNGKVKVELGLVTHKKHQDKRQASKEADAKREMDRAMKAHK